MPAISMSGLLAKEIGRKTPLAKALASSVASGELVNDEAANELVRARILEPDAGLGFILDGYPVTPGQAKALDQFLSEHRFPKPFIIVLEAPDDVLLARMTKRRRADDAAGNIERRIREYRDAGSFTEKWYGSNRIIRVDGTASVEAVARSITRQIGEARSREGLLVRPAPQKELQQRDPAPSPVP